MTVVFHLKQFLQDTFQDEPASSVERCWDMRNMQVDNRNSHYLPLVLEGTLVAQEGLVVDRVASSRLQEDGV